MSIDNIDDILKLFDYLEEKALVLPFGMIHSIEVSTQVFDKIAGQLWNRNLCYVDLRHYTEITLHKDSIKIQIKIKGYYASHIARLQNQYKND